jgi:hypothetical protein
MSQQVLEDLMDKYEARIKKLLSESEERNAALIKETLKPVAEMVSKIRDIECKLDRTAPTLQLVQKADRKNNIMVFGLPDSKSESYAERDTIIEGLSNSLNLRKLDYNDAFRLGIKDSNKNRPMLIKLVRYMEPDEGVQKSEGD